MYETVMISREQRYGAVIGILIGLIIGLIFLANAVNTAH
jgi:tetrahydromethanopterin S-methyltransferase subunit G